MKKLIVIIALLCSIFIFAKGQKQEDITFLNMAELEEALDVAEYLVDNSVFGYDALNLHESLMQAVVKSYNDKYTRYVRKADLERENLMMSNKSSSLGFSFIISGHLNLLRVSDINIASNAYKAGLRFNDYITKVNGYLVSELEEKDLKDVFFKDESKLDLLILRNSQLIPITFSREPFKELNANSAIKDKIGYIRFKTFEDFDGSTLFYNELIKLLDKGITSLIIDLRNNGGGFLINAVNISSMFSKKGEILMKYKYNDRHKDEDESFINKNDPIVPDNIPIVILLNSGSASSSEMLTASLLSNKDNVTLIGSNSFGKGIGQRSGDFYGGKLVMTQFYFTAKDDKIFHKIGFKPDIEVKEYEFNASDMNKLLDFEHDEIALDFIQDHPIFSKENIDLFASIYKDKGISKEALKKYIFSIYINSSNYDAQDLLNSKADLVIEKAIEFLTR